MRNFVPEKKYQYKSEDAGKVFFFAIIALLALNLIFSLVAQQIASGSELDKAEAIENVYNSTLFNSLFALFSLLVLVGVFFAHKRIENFTFSASKINVKIKWHTILVCIAVGTIALLGLQYLTGVFDDFLSLIKFPLDQTSVFKLDNFGQFVVGVLVLALIPAIGEELIFRGVILHGLNSRYSSLASILLSSAMFALFHMNLQQVFYQFLLGSIMAWAVLRTGSLISSMIIHFTSNFLVVLFEFIRNQTGFSFDLPHVWWFYLVAVVLAGITFALFFLIDKYYFKKHSNNEENSKVISQTEEKESKTSGYLWLSLAIAGAMLVVSTVSAYLSV